jgi:hypothetical protein
MAGGYEERAAQRRAVLALLDTLVQENAQVPVPLIRSVSEEFPAQALLLVQRVPREAAKSTLLEWTFGRNNTISDTRSRAAAMILAEGRDPSFIYQVLQGVVQHVTIRVVPPGEGIGGTGSVSCGDSGVLPPPSDWPIIYTYGLYEEHGQVTKRDSDSMSVVRLGEHSIEAYRYEENRGSGGCISPQSDASMRHELIAYWIGVRPIEMEWQPEQNLTLEWSTVSEYKKELGTFLEEDRAKMSETRLSLQKRGLLDEQMIDASFPQISLRFECDIDPCPLANF